MVIYDRLYGTLIPVSHIASINKKTNVDRSYNRFIIEVETSGGRVYNYAFTDKQEDEYNKEYDILSNMIYEFYKKQ